MPKGTTINYFSDRVKNCFYIKVELKMKALREPDYEKRAELYRRYEAVNRLLQDMLDEEVRANPSLASYRGERYE